MATPPGADAVPEQAGRGISSRTVKSTTFEVTTELLATSSAKWRVPVKTPAGNVTSSSWLPFNATVAPRVVTSIVSRRTFDALEKPEPKILTGPTAAEGAPRVILTAAERFAGTEILVGSSMGGVSTRSMFSVLILPGCPSWKTEMLSLPEFTAIATLLMESTARAPGRLTVMAVVEPLGVKLAVASAVWLVETNLIRCNREGSRREISLRFELKESAVLVKGWKATVLPPISGEPVPVPVAPTNRVMKLTDSLIGSMKLIWLEVALGSARMTRRVIGLMAIPTVVG